MHLSADVIAAAVEDAAGAGVAAVGTLPSTSFDFDDDAVVP